MGISSSYYFPLVLHQFLALFGSYCLAHDHDIIKAMFVFGDSLVDVGNNNRIASIAKANHAPNGIDFGNRHTGRFTNGRTIADIIGQEMGLKGFVPPYMARTTVFRDVDHFRGVNYASGGSGILNHTGYLLGGRINMDAQVDRFSRTRQDIISRIGGPKATELLNKALFFVPMGSNDLLINYFITIYTVPRQKLVPPETFVDTMISRYRLQLTRLYNLDARKIVIPNIGPLGCIPLQRDVNPLAGDSCVASSNRVARLFNSKLKSLVMELNSYLVGSRFVYADAYRIVSDIIQNYRSYGFENSYSACCSLLGRFGGLMTCIPRSRICPDRSKYVFWDLAHPTDAANVIIAKRMLDGDLNDIYPINIRQLFNHIN